MPAAAGRPPLYTSVDEVQMLIDEYFMKVTFEHPDTGQFICRPTMSGLAIALDMSRQSLCNYAKKDEFFDTIKRARLEVEQALEQHLYSGSVAGVIFNLKNNFDWKDKSEIDSTQKIEIIELKKDFGE